MTLPTKHALQRPLGAMSAPRGPCREAWSLGSRLANIPLSADYSYDNVQTKGKPCQDTDGCSAIEADRPILERQHVPAGWNDDAAEDTVRAVDSNLVLHRLVFRR